MTPFLADENIDRAVVERLRADGHDVVWVAEMRAGISDDEVLAIANEQRRILVTSDHDFGELVFRQSRVTSGVLLLRLDGLAAATKAAIVSSAVTSHETELRDAFVVIAPGMIRVRRR